MSGESFAVVDGFRVFVLCFFALGLGFGFWLAGIMAICLWNGYGQWNWGFGMVWDWTWEVEN